MATSPSVSSPSLSTSRPGSLHDLLSPHDDDDDYDSHVPSVPVETLVEHLLAAKRALSSSMTLVLRGTELAASARRLHEEATVLGAQTAFLRAGISAQGCLLARARRSMGRAYDGGKRGFRSLIRTLDAANGRLQQTMDMLRGTVVDAVFRPKGEAPRNLLDFVDENSVDGMREAVKDSIAELQAAQAAFDRDLLCFDDDLRLLNKTLASAPPHPSPSASSVLPIPDLLGSLTARSHDMAEALTSLTRHFDLCVTAVRTTEGGAALARRKAAEIRPEEDPVSISGVIADDEDGNTGAGSDSTGLEPISAQERAEMLTIVLQDAAQVDGVLSDLTAELYEMESEYTAVDAHAETARSAYAATIAAFRVLEDIGTRLPGYADAESEFLERWEGERATVAARLDEMGGLREFYEGYAGAYDTLILEAERRRAVEARIRAVWRKARDGVDKLVEGDRREREAFREEVGDYLPGDLWVGMASPLPRWDLVSVQTGEAGQEEGSEVEGVTGEAAAPR